MATSKLIKPTNVTVSIPEFTDQPDQRVNSNCIDKTIDGVNSLNDQIGKFEIVDINVTTNASGSFSTQKSISNYILLGVTFNQNSSIESIDVYEGKIWVVTANANTALTGKALFYKYA